MHDIETDDRYIFQMSQSEAMDLVIYYNIYDTVYGRTLIASTDIGVCFIALGEETFMTQDLFKEYPKARFIIENRDIHNRALSLIANPSEKIDINFHIKGSDFQMMVWEELLKIPAGGKCSYKDIAENIGKPKAVRAVGTAVGQNPISCLIPCHRVIGKNRDLTGFTGGVDIKDFLLNLEFLKFN